MQCLADDFFIQWIELTGYDGVTNYIHLIGAGHLRFFLNRWGNLHRFQNQGWEAYNAMVTAFWHHRTQKGGGKHVVSRSKILPIARWILRLMLWRTGEAQQFFRNLEENESLLDEDGESSNDESSISDTESECSNLEVSSVEDSSVDD